MGMQKQISDSGTSARWPAAALVGVLLAFVGGLFVAQAGGSDRSTFLTIGFLFGACGLVGIIAGGVALGLELARRAEGS